MCLTADGKIVTCEQLISFRSVIASFDHMVTALGCVQFDEAYLTVKPDCESLG